MFKVSYQYKNIIIQTLYSPLYVWCMLRLSRFPARLHFRDRGECGNKELFRKIVTKIITAFITDDKIWNARTQTYNIDKEHVVPFYYLPLVKYRSWFLHCYSLDIMIRSMFSLSKYSSINIQSLFIRCISWM